MAKETKNFYKFMNMEKASNFKITSMKIIMFVVQN